jgi:hypothetical protein
MYKLNCSRSHPATADNSFHFVDSEHTATARAIPFCSYVRVPNKRAIKDKALVFSRIATAMKANTHETAIIHFARRLTHAGPVSVIPVPLASSVICVVTQLAE